MGKISSLLPLLGAMVLATLHASPADAFLDRTWVASNGADSNPCDRLTPCATFAAAYAQTNTGGEINCVDSGNFGAIFGINRSLTINCEGTIATNSNPGASGVGEFVVNSSAGDVVILKGLELQGFGTASNGIVFTGEGALHIHKVRARNFRGWAGGIGILPTGAAQVYISDSTITDNGAQPGTGGIFVQPFASGTSTAIVVTDSKIENNLHGMVVVGNNTSGSIRMSVKDSTVVGNSGNGITATTTQGSINLMLNNVVAANNGNIGVANNGPNATTRIGGSLVSGNATGVHNGGGGTLRSFKTNQIRGNANNGTPISADALE
jgi:hypothetical protein